VEATIILITLSLPSKYQSDTVKMGILSVLQVKQKNVIYGQEEISRWGNRDLYPIIPSERTWTSKAFFAYWVTTCICVNSWTLGSSLIGYGLTAGQTCGAVLIGGVISGIMAVLCGQVGRDLHLGYVRNLQIEDEGLMGASYPMMGRASFGLYGSYFVILIKCLVSLVFFGFNAYYGGQAVVLILSAMSPGFMNMKNTLPAR
jgi:nucleobase:cation symporter-1, NCS1 family